MLLTVALLVLGAGLTWWAARVLHTRSNKPSMDLDLCDVDYPEAPRKRGSAVLVAAVGMAITLSVCSLLWFGHYYNERWVACHITSLEDQGDNKYRVQTANCGTLDNVNALPWFKANSLSLQGQLRKGVVFELRVAGASSKWWGWNPNIVAIK